MACLELQVRIPPGGHHLDAGNVGRCEFSLDGHRIAINSEAGLTVHPVDVATLVSDAKVALGPTSSVHRTGTAKPLKKADFPSIVVD